MLPLCLCLASSNKPLCSRNGQILMRSILEITNELLFANRSVDLLEELLSSSDAVQKVSAPLCGLSVALSLQALSAQARECCKSACRELQCMHRRGFHSSWVVWTALRPLAGQGPSPTSCRHAPTQASSTGRQPTQWQRMPTCNSLRSRPHHALEGSSRCHPDP